MKEAALADPLGQGSSIGRTAVRMAIRVAHLDNFSGFITWLQITFDPFYFLSLNPDYLKAGRMSSLSGNRPRFDITLPYWNHRNSLLRISRFGNSLKGGNP